VTYPDGSQVSHAYDPVFHLRTRTEDENGVVTTYAYDGHGNMIRKAKRGHGPGAGDHPGIR